MSGGPAGRHPGDPAGGQVEDPLGGQVEDPAGGQLEDPADRPGVPDALQRLWTPHRMVYVGDTGGDVRPRTGEAESCPFCASPPREDADALVVHRGAAAFVVLNLFPYNPGHLLICTYRHVADLTDLTVAERDEIGRLSARAMRVLRAVSSPAGFNLGMNQGGVAGAGIASHIHQHVVPRWAGDANFLPIIGRTKALPQLLSETRTLLADAWDDAAHDDHDNDEDPTDESGPGT
ncbi:HIT family protein [Georgenia sp. Z1491]|uniref:HIT family protein n=1 Tax=Georgenia sp. Z1491 TaxID=3416707 RepID=UPI003CF4AE9A